MPYDGGYAANADGYHSLIILIITQLILQFNSIYNKFNYIEMLDITASHSNIQTPYEWIYYDQGREEGIRGIRRI